MRLLRFRFSVASPSLDSLPRKRDRKSPPKWQWKILHTRNGGASITAHVSGMKTQALPKATEEIRSYAQLQRQIHEALRAEHPEWVKPNGDCPTCDSYQARLAELLGLALPNKDRSLA
jgi:DNA-binding helix-hairpin-helix protein with protein kinase domain